ncbi:kinase-like domain-containing protein [Gigaspora rosea]|uniref:Kinase-like domain-containing protein n=1 Tax=Gigaspora rosea TaxID=44941 RepID=A0A397VKE1_9GLOM|nr:kinase-like domain-containing protein [Gigaspora rosea]
MQYAKQGSLRKLLDSKYNDLNWNYKINILCYIARGLNTVHKAKLMHKDFHSGNIVNGNMVNSYITDFGLCKPVSQKSSSEGIFGVLPYIAPEVLYGKEYTQKSDIYSFGIIMSEVLTGYPPYHDIPHDEDLAIKICLGYRPEIKCKVPRLLLDLMNKCLDAEPQNRPNAEELDHILYEFYDNSKNEKAELYKQLKEIKNSSKNSNQVISIRLNYQTHKQAIYTSRLLKYQNLPKPINAKPVVAEIGKEYDNFFQDTPYQIYSTAITHIKLINTNEITQILQNPRISEMSSQKMDFEILEEEEQEISQPFSIGLTREFKRKVSISAETQNEDKVRKLEYTKSTEIDFEHSRVTENLNQLNVPTENWQISIPLLLLT